MCGGNHDKALGAEAEKCLFGSDRGHAFNVQQISSLP